ncbi:MAG: hypothetical protein K2O24_00745 [Muribaculaceae bacterium]|nr:hypothetical protein [Muribaculaceae bacterium]
MGFSIAYLIIILLTCLSFTQMEDSENNPVQLLSQMGVAVLFLAAVWKSLRRPAVPSLLKVWLVGIGLCLCGLFILPSYTFKSVMGDTRELFIPFALTFSSYYLLKFTPEQFRRGFMVVALCSILAVMYTVANSGGFIVQDMYRAGVFKNQTAPFYAQIGLISLCLYLDRHRNVWDLLFLGAFIAAIVYCVVLRARTATFATLGLAVIILWEKYHAKSLLIIPAVLIVVFGIWGDQLTNVLYASMVGHYDATDIDSMTTGRATRMADSLDFIYRHPLWGSTVRDLTANTVWRNTYHNPHNYLVWKLVRYGLVYAVPFIMVYLAVLWNGIKLLRISWSRYQYVIMCLALAFLTSLSEYSAPFGPGTSWVICYCLLGSALRSSGEQTGNAVLLNEHAMLQ